MSSHQLQMTFRSWPKMIFSWPGVFAAFGAAAVTYSWPQHAAASGLLFLAAWGAILVVLSFEFTRSGTLALIFAVIAIVIGAVLINQQQPFLAKLQAWLETRNTTATPEFYFFFGLIHACCMGLIALNSRFNYWVISPSELTHKRGFLGNTERYPTDGLKIHTEIGDVFEYMLARSGKMILSIPGVTRPIVLENVVGIKSIEHQVDTILNARNVRVNRPLATRYDKESPSFS